MQKRCTEFPLLPFLTRKIPLHAISNLFIIMRIKDGCCWLEGKAPSIIIRRSLVQVRLPLSFLSHLNHNCYITSLKGDKSLKMGFFVFAVQNSAVKKQSQPVHPTKTWNNEVWIMASIFKRKLKEGNGFSWRAIIRLEGHPAVCESFDTSFAVPAFYYFL